MRLALAFLSEDKPLLQTLESIVRCGRSVAFVSKCCSLKDTQLFLESVFNFLEAFMRNANVFLSKENPFLQTIETALIDVNGVLCLFLNGLF